MADDCCAKGSCENEDKILNKDNLDLPAEANIDLDAMHPEVQIPKQQWPLTEDELSNDFVMLTEDGGIKKKIITESPSPNLGSPPAKSKVICHYTGTLPQQNDEKFDSSRDRNDPFSFKIGTGQVIKGWDIGIASFCYFSLSFLVYKCKDYIHRMKKGERCILRCASPYAYGENGSPPKIPGGATLDFDVELIEWDDWNECETNSGISKKVQICASDDMATEIDDDCAVNISYSIYYILDDGDHILCERTKQDMIVCDDDRFTTAFHDCLKSMKDGERSLFKIKDASLINVDDLWCDEEELKANEFNNNKQCAPKDALTYYQITVHSVVKAKEKYNAENEERIKEGMRYKEAGNALFKALRFNGAITKYDKCLDWIDVDFSDDALAKEKSQLLVSANNNLSLIYVKLKDWSNAIERASNVLNEDKNNLKALMRRGQARLEDGFLDLAKKDLKKALSLDKENSYIKKLLKICTKRHKKYVQKQQKLYAGMFGGSGKKKKKKNEKDEKKMEVEEVEKEKEKPKAEAMDVDKEKVENV